MLIWIRTSLRRQGCLKSTWKIISQAWRRQCRLARPEWQREEGLGWLGHLLLQEVQHCRPSRGCNKHRLIAQWWCWGKLTENWYQTFPVSCFPIFLKLYHSTHQCILLSSAAIWAILTSQWHLCSSQWIFSISSYCHHFDICIGGCTECSNGICHLSKLNISLKAHTATRGAEIYTCVYQPSTP
jgi:hypothetical protein